MGHLERAAIVSEACPDATRRFPGRVNGSPATRRVDPRMALLRCTRTGTLVSLYPRHLVGRSSAADLTIDDRLCSARHCEVRWLGHEWTIHDLNSRNGTWVDGRRITPDGAETLERGGQVGFGNPSQPWEVIDTTAPNAVLISPEGEPTFADNGVIEVRSATAEERICVRYLDDEGWVIERPGADPDPAPAESVVSIDGRPWRLLCPLIQAETERFVPRLALDALTLRFHLTHDGARCRIEAVVDGVVMPIEPRSHDRLLLFLARARQADPDRGWVHRDDVWRALRLDEAELNVWIYRIRRQYSGLGFQGSGRLIERQQGEGTLRLGVREVVVVPPLPPEPGSAT